MKKTIYYFSVIILFVSCQKSLNSELGIDQKTDKSAIVEPVEEINKVNKSGENFNESFFYFAGLLSPTGKLTISFDSHGNYIWNLCDPCPPSTGAVRCESDELNVSFAKCVKDALEKYGCQVISGDEDNGWTSEDC